MLCTRTKRRGTPRALAFAAVLLLALTARGLAADLTLGNGADLPTLGLHLRVFREFTNRPWPAATAYTYENPQLKLTVEAYAPQDLFRQDQVLASFQGPSGTVTVAVLRYLPLTDLPLINKQHVRLEDYRKRAEQAPSVAKAEDLQPWVEAFTGQAVKAAMEGKAGLNGQYRCHRFSFVGQDAEHHQACVVELARQPQALYALLLYDLAESLPAKAAAAAITHSEETVTYSPVKASEKAAVAVTPVTHGGAAGGGAHSAEYAATVQRVTQNLANLKDWWYVELPDYVLATNLDRREKRLIGMLQDDLQLLRPAYAALVPARTPINEVSVVRIFRSAQEYHDYVPPAIAWSAGAWMPGKKELALAPLDVSGTVLQGNAQAQRQLVLGVAYHEAFHQYLYYALGRNELPPWFNEGLATFIEGADVDNGRKRVLIPENPQRVEVINRLLAVHQKIQVAPLLAMDYTAYYQKDRAELNYASGYALTYFLRKAAWLYPGQHYEQLSDAVVDAVMAANGDLPATAAAVAKTVKLDRLEADLNDFWASPAKRKKAEAYDPLTAPKPKPAN